MKFTHIDIHSHVSFKEFDADRSEVLARMGAADVATITVGVDLESSKRAVISANENDRVYAAIGLHPADNTAEEFVAKDFEKLVKNPKVVAIGECGLDFYRRDGVLEVERVRQKKELEAQISFALTHDKPLMIHCRSAHEEMLKILGSYKKEAGERLRGNIHFFTGTIAFAKVYNDLGFTVSFPGVITFTSEYDEVVRSVPLSMIMAETDAPFASPVPYRGKRNEPSFIIETIQKIAAVRSESFLTVSATLRQNSNRVFGI